MRDHKNQQFDSKAVRAFIESQLPLYRGDKEAFARVYGLRLRDVNDFLAGGVMPEWMMIRLGFQFDKKNARYVLTTPPDVSYYPPISVALDDLREESELYRARMNRRGRQIAAMTAYMRAHGIDVEAMKAWVRERLAGPEPITEAEIVEMRRPVALPEPVVVASEPAQPGDDSAADTEVLIRFIKNAFPTVKAFATQYGYPYPSVNNIVRGERRAGLSFLKAIRDAMAWDTEQREIADAAA